MNKILFLVISYLCIINTNAQSYRLNFMNALNEKNMARAEEVLRAWDINNSNDPELYIAYFNFYTIKSQDAALPIAITGYDQQNSKLALDYITEGINRFPTRFDMRVAKIYMLGVLRNYQAYVAEALKMIAYSAKIDNNWKREEFMILDKPEDMFFDAVLDWQAFLFSKKDPSLYKEVIRISNEMLKYYPQHVQSMLNISTVYKEQKEFDKSLDILLKANMIEPTNAIILYNIADVYNKKGDKANARKYYELTIPRCKEDEENLKEAAKFRLEELK